MTKRAYYENGALECEATVLRCRAMENGFEILTDVTSIFRKAEDSCQIRALLGIPASPTPARRAARYGISAIRP